MRAKHAYLAVACAAFSALVVIASASKAQAGYPMISGIPNQYIYMNSETGVIPFN